MPAERAAIQGPASAAPQARVEQVKLGATGLRVSRLALGMMSYGSDPGRAWKLDEDQAEPIVRQAVEAGITFFDTADMYAQGASEIVTGRLLRKLITRDEAVVATKVFYPTSARANGGGLSRKHILSAIDASLTRLGMDYVDLYQIHRWDPDTPIEETMEALHEVIKSGKARYLGASFMAAWQFAKAQHVAERHGWTRFVSIQIPYDLLYREEERELIPQCVDQGVAVLAYSPLARGLLAGTRTRSGQRNTTRATTDAPQNALYGLPEDFDVIDRVTSLADQRGQPPAQIALAWLLHKPHLTAPIIGATKLKHLQDALAATNLQLTQDESRNSRTRTARTPCTTSGRRGDQGDRADVRQADSGRPGAPEVRPCAPRASARPQVRAGSGLNVRGPCGHGDRLRRQSQSCLARPACPARAESATTTLAWPGNCCCCGSKAGGSPGGRGSARPSCVGLASRWPAAGGNPRAGPRAASRRVGDQKHLSHDRAHIDKLWAG